MLYSVYVHLGDDKHAQGVTIPDFPGCFSAANDWDSLPANIQEAIELYCEGENMEIHVPPPLEQLVSRPESMAAGGCRCFTVIDQAGTHQYFLAGKFGARH